MPIGTPSEGDDQKIELSPEVIQQVVDILAETYPLGHERTPFIAEPYLIRGGASNYGIDNIVWAVKEKTGLDFLAISDNEKKIIPAYLKRIGYQAKNPS